MPQHPFPDPGPDSEEPDRSPLPQLPATFAALAAGRIHPVHVRIIADETSVLSDQDAANADKILAGAAPGQTFGELRHAAHKLAATLTGPAAPAEAAQATAPAARVVLAPPLLPNRPPGRASRRWSPLPSLWLPCKAGPRPPAKPAGSARWTPTTPATWPPPRPATPAPGGVLPP